MFFFLIVVGFFHGFVLLPIFLSWVNIEKYYSNSTSNSNIVRIVDEGEEKEFKKVDKENQIDK